MHAAGDAKLVAQQSDVQMNGVREFFPRCNSMMLCRKGHLPLTEELVLAKLSGGNILDINGLRFDDPDRTPGL